MIKTHGSKKNTILEKKEKKYAIVNPTISASFSAAENHAICLMLPL
jgi:hypothetical protein